MTIVAGAACREGLAIAGDSRTTIDLGAGRRAATDYARKIYSIDDKFVAATFGWAIVEGKTIAGVVREFDELTPAMVDVDQAATELRDYFQARLQAHIAAGLDPAPPPGVDPLGFIVGGYDVNRVGKIKVVLPFTGAIHEMCGTDNPGGVWNGEWDVMVRLLKGYDTMRIDPSKWAKRSQKALAEAEYHTPFEWFALQDVIDWTVFVARTTIDTQRFTNGTVSNPGAVPTCGGEIEVAIITDEGVRWIQRTDLRG